MNRKQGIATVLVVLALAMMALYPPWTMTSPKRPTSSAYGWIFAPPRYPQWVAEQEWQQIPRAKATPVGVLTLEERQFVDALNASRLTDYEKQQVWDARWNPAQFRETLKRVARGLPAGAVESVWETRMNARPAAFPGPGARVPGTEQLGGLPGPTAPALRPGEMSVRDLFVWTLKDAYQKARWLDQNPPERWSARLDLTRLMVQWALLVIVGGGLVLGLKDR